MVRFKADLLDLIESAHAHGLQVYADLVFNHDGCADVEISANGADSLPAWGSAPGMNEFRKCNQR